MLSTSKTLKGYQLNAKDGLIGNVRDFYFDDSKWTIRYLVANTGDWLNGREVLVSPHALRNINKTQKSIKIDSTKKQIEGSPTLMTSMPITRQQEEGYNEYFGWPMYFYSPYMFGMSLDYLQEGPAQEDEEEVRRTYNSNLKNTFEVTGYKIQAKDGDIGHVENFIIDDETWAIRYIVVDTQNWWSGEKVLIAPKWIEKMSSIDSTIFLSLTRDQVKKSPPYSEELLITRDYEEQLHKHYRRQGYWVEETKTHAAYWVENPEHHERSLYS